ncbi:hypothetical protein D9M71_751380 [compost metagenome]
MTQQDLPIRQVLETTDHAQYRPLRVTPGLGPELQIMRLAKELNSNRGADGLAFFDQLIIVSLILAALLGG